MKKDNIDQLFNTLKGTFDTEEPNLGHELRFLEKLNTLGETSTKAPKKNYNMFFAIAASFIVLFGLGIIFFNNTPNITEQVFEISPEISKTEFYFANVIQQEINKLENEKTPETKKIIEDTMIQLTKLEKDYKNLELDLINGGNSKFILSAMIINFQTRIDLLQDVLNQIDEIKKIKNSENEKTII
jgi:uncharacterized protein YsxB (DUF464 family)